MKAVAYIQSLPIEHEHSLLDMEIPEPVPGPRDLLVRIRGISVNPADTKVRMRRAGSAEAPVILGWDAAGIVEAVGAEVSLFRPGDEVMYAGSITRAGSYAQYGVVDERIAGRKPRSLSFAEAAALPLTALTAWEALFDRLNVPLRKESADDAILIVGAAGGVGSMAVQLARRLTALTIIATASRPESKRWATERGAHVVIDHRLGIAEEFKRLALPPVRYVLSLRATDQHWNDIITVLAPQGHICLIDDPKALDVTQLKSKAASLHYEFMFTRSMFETPDMLQQHRLLNEVSELIEAGLLKTTVGRHLGSMSASGLRSAHALIEAGESIGKLVFDVD